MALQVINLCLNVAILIMMIKIYKQKNNEPEKDKKSEKTSD